MGFSNKERQVAKLSWRRGVAKFSKAINWTDPYKFLLGVAVATACITSCCCAWSAPLNFLGDPGHVSDPIGDSDFSDIGTVDLISASAVVFGEQLRLRVTSADATDESWVAQILWDSDQNPATGFPGVDGANSDSDLIGADYSIYLSINNVSVVKGFQGLGSVTPTIYDNGIEAFLPLAFFNNDDGIANYKIVSYRNYDEGGSTGVLDYFPDLGSPPASSISVPEPAIVSVIIMISLAFCICPHRLTYATNRYKNRSLIAGFVAMSCLTNSLRASTFHGIPGLYSASAISSNGKFVMGLGGVWSITNGTIALKGLHGNLIAGRGGSVSNDGKTVVGPAPSSNEGGGAATAGLWLDGYPYYTHHSSGETELFGVSGDGKTLVGAISGRGASVWDIQGPDTFPLFPGTPSPDRGTLLPGADIGEDNSYAFDISDDGRTILAADSTGTVILRDRIDVGPLTGQIGYANKISPNGKLIGGSFSGGFIYDLDQHVQTNFSNTGGTYTAIGGISNNGRVVGQSLSSGSPSSGFYWDNGLASAIDIKDYLIYQPGFATSLAGWTITSANDISADGRTIVGNGINPQGQQQAWIADLSKHVVLNFGFPAPGNFVQKVDPTGKSYHVYNQSGTGLGSATISASDQLKLIEDIQAIFDRSGIKNIEVTTTPMPDAVNVYFSATDKPGNNKVTGASLSEYLSPVTNQFVLGVNRHATGNTGNVLVFPAAFTANMPPLDYGGLEYVAETVAHEVGHALGLMHVDNDGPSGSIEVMDYNARKNDMEMFLNAVTPVVSFNKGIVTPVTDPISQHIYSSNPVYALRHYVDGIPETALAAAGIFPGDLENNALMIVDAKQYKMIESDQPLYDIEVLLSGSLAGEDIYVIKDMMSVSTVSEIVSLLNDLPLGYSLRLSAASESGGPLDIALVEIGSARLDEFDIPLSGGPIKFALAKYDVGGQITILATGAFGAIPEPQSLTSALAAFSAIIFTRRTARL